MKKLDMMTLTELSEMIDWAKREIKEWQEFIDKVAKELERR